MKFDSLVSAKSWGRQSHNYWKATVGDRIGEVAGDPGGSLLEYAGRMEINLRNANTRLEVGPTDSTPSAGKPCTWGSGGAVKDLFGDTSAALRGGA